MLTCVLVAGGVRGGDDYFIATGACSGARGGRWHVSLLFSRAGLRLVTGEKLMGLCRLILHWMAADTHASLRPSSPDLARVQAATRRQVGVARGQFFNDGVRNELNTSQSCYKSEQQRGPALNAPRLTPPWSFPTLDLDLRMQ